MLPASLPQVYCVLSAIRERKKQFLFTDGTTVALDDRVGFFITMNPGALGSCCHAAPRRAGRDCAQCQLPSAAMVK